MTLLKGNTRFFVLVGVLLLVGLAIACTNDDAPRSQSTPVSTDGLISDVVPDEITPSQTSATEPDSVPLQPVIRLHYGGQVYDGVPGNFCWPVEPGASLSGASSVCGVEKAYPWRDLDLPVISVTVGDSIMVEIEADDRPQKLQAAIFEEASEHASDTAMQVAELDPGLKAPLAVDVPAGVYNMRITGHWGVGDQAYKFRLKVE